MTQPPRGVKTSAYIFFAYAGLLVLVLCYFIFTFSAAAIGASGGDTEGIAAVVIGPAIGGCVALLFLALYAGTGYGLLKVQKWARVAAIVLSVLALCSFPIGTAMGGYVLYLMFREENKQAFA